MPPWLIILLLHVPLVVLLVLNWERVLWFLICKMRFRDFLLVLAATQGKIWLIDFLIRVLRADPNARDRLTFTESWVDEDDNPVGVPTREVMETPILQHAALSGHVEAVEALLAHGADVNGTCCSGGTALTSAVGRNDPAMVRCLLEHGADSSIRTVGGETAEELGDRIEADEAVEALRAWLREHPA